MLGTVQGFYLNIGKTAVEKLGDISSAQNDDMAFEAEIFS